MPKLEHEICMKLRNKCGAMPGTSDRLNILLYGIPQTGRSWTGLLGEKLGEYGIDTLLRATSVVSTYPLQIYNWCIRKRGREREIAAIPVLEHRPSDQ